MMPSYPDDVPELHVRGRSGLDDEQSAELLRRLVERGGTLRGAEMCFELIELAREFVADEARRQCASVHDVMLERQEAHDKVRMWGVACNQAD